VQPGAPGLQLAEQPEAVPQARHRRLQADVELVARELAAAGRLRADQRAGAAEIGAVRDKPGHAQVAEGKVGLAAGGPLVDGRRGEQDGQLRPLGREQALALGVEREELQRGPREVQRGEAVAAVERRRVRGVVEFRPARAGTPEPRVVAQQLGEVGLQRGPVGAVAPRQLAGLAGGGGPAAGPEVLN